MPFSLPLRTTAAALCAALTLLLSASSGMAQSSFTCSYGKPACLGFGDKVVHNTDICFDLSTCDSSGFVCKSDYDRNVRDYSELIDDYGATLDDYNELVGDYNVLYDYAEDITSCVETSGTLAEAKACL